MTKKELSQLYWLEKEVKEQEERIKELGCLVTSCTSNLTGMPKGNAMQDKISTYVAELVDLKCSLEENYIRCLEEMNKISAYIEMIGDGRIRYIMRLRYLKGLSWLEIAYKLGGRNTADGARMTINRFLKKENQKTCKKRGERV